MSKIDELRLGFETAYIDGSVVSSNIYRPQFVSNNHKEGKKVLSSIEDELLVCDGFQISVAFITMNGITPLLQTLKELEKRKTGRRICDSCHAVYNINEEAKKPIIESVCDKCGGKLRQRNDDNIEAFQNRYVTYQAKTEPIIKHYV